MSRGTRCMRTYHWNSTYFHVNWKWCGWYSSQYWSCRRFCFLYSSHSFCVMQFWRVYFLFVSIPYYTSHFRSSTRSTNLILNFRLNILDKLCRVKHIQINSNVRKCSIFFLVITLNRAELDWNFYKMWLCSVCTCNGFFRRFWIERENTQHSQLLE